MHWLYCQPTFMQGSVSATLKKFQLDKLDPQATETVDWMKSALDAESVWAVNPNLIFSSDDTTLFAIEGVQGGGGEWEWKIIDATNNNSLVHSNFNIISELEAFWGLRVRPAFSITSSRLAAPPYVAVSRLSNKKTLS